MADVQGSAAPVINRREDYRPPVWRVPDISLEFELDPARTLVRSRMAVERHGEGPLALNHGGQEVLAVRVDGEAAEYRAEAGELIVQLPGITHLVEIECALTPNTNTELARLARGQCCRSSVVERILGKAEVVSSILTGSTILLPSSSRQS